MTAFSKTIVSNRREENAYGTRHRTLFRDLEKAMETYALYPVLNGDGQPIMRRIDYVGSGFWDRFSEEIADKIFHQAREFAKEEIYKNIFFATFASFAESLFNTALQTSRRLFPHGLLVLLFPALLIRQQSIPFATRPNAATVSKGAADENKESVRRFVGSWGGWGPSTRFRGEVSCSSSGMYETLFSDHACNLAAPARPPFSALDYEP